jgi:cytochrome c biogenesis protein CcmG/thiol:disulfide interchange protein DsbE
MPPFVRYLTPLVLFLALAGLLYMGLGIDPRVVPSPLIGKPAPEFSLPSLEEPLKTVSLDDLKGQVTLFNVWATWCTGCRAEHPALMRLAQSGVKIYGLAYKDDRAEARRWLERSGNPYIANAFDEAGRVAIDWGVYGAPETFLVDRDGIIRYKHIGPITDDTINAEIMPRIKQLKEKEG